MSLLIKLLLKICFFFHFLALKLNRLAEIFYNYKTVESSVKTNRFSVYDQDTIAFWNNKNLFQKIKLANQSQQLSNSLIYEVFYKDKVSVAVERGLMPMNNLIGVYCRDYMKEKLKKDILE